jgi:fumarylpyruvate hydrolase
MIWPTADVIAFLSRFVRLEAGDLIMTGTPAGVGALHPGDVCVVTIEGVGSVTTRIGAVAAS